MPRQQPIPLFLVVDRTVGWTTQFEPVDLFPIRGPDTQPQGAFRLGQWTCALGEIAESAEMHMKDQVAAKVIAEMLAVGDDAAKFSSV